MTHLFHFIGPAFVVLVVGLFAFGKWRQARYRDAPWTGRPGWASGRIPATGTSVAAIAANWSIVVVCAALPLIAVWLLRQRLGLTPKDPLLLFAMAFAALWIFAFVRSAPFGARRAYGIVFVMDPVPGRIGGAVSGRVDLSPGDAPLGETKATLACLVDTLPVVVPTVHWRETRTLVATGDSFISVAFTTPATLRNSDPIGGCRWILSIVTKTRRGKLKARFNLPVFKLDPAAAEGKRGDAPPQ